MNPVGSKYRKPHPVARFFKFVQEDPETGCWIWLGGCARGHQKLAYGKFWVDGKTIPAHLWAYEHLREITPNPSLQCDHLCRNPSCVNPWHLEEVTARVNTLRGVGPSAINATKVVCMRGHAFTDENTYVDKLGKRNCRTCHREKERARLARKRANIASEV